MANRRSPSENLKRQIECRRKDYRKQKSGFRLLPREILFSEAYAHLSGSAAKILLLARNQVRFGPGNQMINDVLHLTHVDCMVIGVGSSQTITRARNELVDKGFLDVYRTGSGKGDASQFKISERWRKYTYGHQRKDSRPVGYHIYPEKTLANPDHPIHKKRNARKSHI